MLYMCWLGFGFWSYIFVSGLKSSSAKEYAQKLPTKAFLFSFFKMNYDK